VEVVAAVHLRLETPTDFFKEEMDYLLIFAEHPKHLVAEAVEEIILHLMLAVTVVVEQVHIALILPVSLDR
tara:strand:+ start:471 stop:683 length:213 start_codon:yes stop_codon:yes gene_type:complete